MSTPIRSMSTNKFWPKFGGIKGGMNLTVIVSAILMLCILGLWAAFDYVEELQVNALNAQSRVYGLKLEESFKLQEERVKSQSRQLGDSRQFKLKIATLMRDETQIQRAELRTREGQLTAEYDRAMEKPIWPVLSRITPPPSLLLGIEQSIRSNRVGWSRSWAPNGDVFIEMIIPIPDQNVATVLISPIRSLLPPYSGIDAQLEDYEFSISTLNAQLPSSVSLKLPELNLAIAINPKRSKGISSALLDGRGKFILLISILLILLLVKNLLDARAHQQSLALIEQQAQALEKYSQSQAINELTSTLAHEINQPLATIVNLIATCEVKITSSSEHQEIQKTLSQARGEAMRAAEIVRTLRAWFKHEGVNEQIVEVHKVFDRLKPILEFIGHQNQSKIKIREGVIASIKADPLLLELTILNLVKNSIEAMKNTHVNDRHIILRSKLLDSHFDAHQDLIPQRVEISVQDRGSGISPDIEPHIFDFSFSTKSQGMGIGLSFCKNFTERVGGTLKWDANADQGVTFRLILPAISNEVLT